MSDSIVDLRYIADSQPSLCIPRVFNNIDDARIRIVFEQLDLGKIHHIDIIARKNEKGESFKRVYIHFEKWFWNETAKAARTKLVSGKEIKIVYDNPWFWKVSANKWAPSSKEPEIRRIAQPYIQLGELGSALPVSIAPTLPVSIAPTLPREQEMPREQKHLRPRHQNALKTRDQKPREPRNQKPLKPRDQKPEKPRDQTPEKPRDQTPEKPRYIGLEDKPLDPRPDYSPPHSDDPRDEDSMPEIDYNVPPVPPKKVIKLLKREVKLEKKPELCEVKESSDQSVDPLYADLDM
jgi:hypothetical protein